MAPILRQLRGTIEVAGRRADIVVANPNGITCDGCGFLNSSRATLTTGQPQFNSDGSIRGLDVRQGQLTVGGNGLNASNLEQLDLIARGVVIEGDVWANNLNVIAGANQVLYGTLQAAAQGGSGTAPRFAIDIKDLGGMYANQIYLVSNEKGLGVNSTGRMAALQGNLILSANGDLTLNDSYARQNIQINGAGNVKLTGQTASDGATSITAAGSLANHGMLDAKEQLTLQAAAIGNSGTIAQRGTQGAMLNATGGLTNTGTLYSAGNLTANAGSIHDSQGTLLAGGELQLQAGNMTLAGTRLASDRNVTLSATTGNLDARASSIQSGGNLALSAAGTLDIGGGNVQAAGNANLAAAALLNQGGTVYSGAQLTVGTAGAIDNSAGKLLAAGGVNVAAQSLDNRAGQILSDTGAQLALGGALNNAGGRLVVRDGLAINTGSLVNDRAGAAQGVIASTDGAVAINAAQTSNIGGVITAGTNMTLATQALDNTFGEVSSGAQLALNTNGQVLKNDGGKLLAGGGVAVQAGAISSKAIATVDGIRTAQIAAAGGMNIQASAFANDGSALFAGQGIALSLAGGSFSNAGGMIEAANSVGITSGAADNQGGRIVANQAVSVQVASMNNSGGEISSAGNVALVSTAGVDNSGGKIVSNGNLGINASTLTNASGTVSAAGTATLSLGSGLLDNTQGSVVGAQALQLQSGEIRNQSGTIASGSALSLDTQGASLTNTGGGQIVASGDLSIASARFDNTSGTAASISGQLQVNTAGQQLMNDDGKLQAAGNALIIAGATSSQSGLISGHDVTAVTGNLDNSGGTIAAGGKLDMSTQALANDGGLLQSVGDARIDTGSQVLVNTNSGNTGGIVAGGDLTILAGGIDSRAGFIAGTGSLALTVAGDLDNRALGGKAGQIVSNGSGTISAANLFNQQGSINTLANLDVSAGLIDNRAGAIAANGALQLSATTLDNRADGGVAGAIDAASITATVNTIDNRGGALRAAGNAGITAAALDNSSGDISAGNNLDVSAATLGNSGGRLVGNNSVTVSTASQSFGGTIASSNDVTLNVSGDYLNSSLLSAQRNLTVNAANITNSGTLTAGETLTANTGNLANSGEISGQNVVINASGTLTNSASGLIDGVDTRINAGTVNNTGRIYGDFLRLNAGTINNSGSGTIAARDTLLIGAQYLNNTVGGLIYSLGDIGMGGSVDAGGQLQGAMQSLVNASSRIEAGGNLTIAAANLLNRNDGLTTTQITDAPVTKQMVQPVGSATSYPIAQCSGIGGGQDANGCIVHPDKYGLRTAITPVYSQVCTLDPNTFNQICTEQPNYAWNAPVFAEFGVATVGVAPPAEPFGGCSMSLEGTIVPIVTPACNQWRSDYAVWDTAYHATLAQLETKVNPYNAEVNEDNRVHTFEDYTLTTLTSTKTHTEVATTAPGQILSGGNMSLSGTVTNQDSQIVAGGTLSISGPAVNNIATQGEQRTDYSGTTMYTEVVSCGSFGSKHCRNWYGPNPYNPAPEIVMTDLPTVRYEAAAGNQTLARNLAVATAAIDTSVANVAAAAAGNTRTAAVEAVQAVLATNAAAGVAGNAPPVVQSVVANGAAHEVILTAQPPLAIPNNKLFVLHAAPSSRYLVETDPRFTNYRSFISSDYFLQALNRDPERQLKRYGDGFMEQKLVNDQILALTGRRYLSGYSNTEDEYKALMDAGVAFARAYQLTPGVALSAEQMALLTTDIVWLVERTVMLPDGTSQQVLVPQVYLRRPGDGDLQANGALMAGSDVLIQTQGNLANSGTIKGDTVTVLAGRDLVNQGGRISGQDILLRANNDLKNLSGVIQGAGANSSVALLAGRDIVLQTQTLGSVNNDGSSTRTSVQRVATIQGGNVQLEAMRDLAVAGAAVTAERTLLATAGRDIKVAAVAGEYQLDVQDKSGRATQGRTAYVSEAATRNQTSTFRSDGDLVLAAGNNVKLQGANVAAGTSGSGDALIQGANVIVEAAKDRTAADLQTVGKKNYNRNARDNETLVGGTITAGDNITVRATGNSAEGAGDITLTGATVAAQHGQVTLAANRDITIQEAVTRHAAIDESYVKSGNLLRTTATVQSSSTTLAQVEGSSISGNNVLLHSGADTTVQGSMVTAAEDLQILAGRDTHITSAQERSSSSHFYQSTSSATGFAKLLGASVAAISLEATAALITKKSEMRDGDHVESQAVGSAFSARNIGIGSGRDVGIQGSTIVADRDIDIHAGRNLGIVSAQSTVFDRMSASSKKSGFVGSVWQPAIGKVKQNQDEQSVGASQTGSQIASLGSDGTGNVTLRAGEQYVQTASGVLAQAGDIDIAARNVTINEAYDSSQATQHQQYSKTALGGSVSVPLLNAVQGMVSMGQAAKASGDSRMQALAAINAGMNAKAAADSMQAMGNGNFGGIKVSVSIGSSKSESSSTQTASSVVGSSIAAAGDVRIQATGAGQDSNLTAIAAEISAGNNVSLQAENQVNLLAAQNTLTVKSDNKSSGASIGIGFAIGGSQNGFTLDIGASKARGNADGSDIVNVNTHVNAGNVAVIQSGGDTNLEGAVVAGRQVTADVGGNLNIASLQDTSVYDSKQSSGGFGVSLCIPPFCYGASSVSGGVSKAKANGDYASVVEQSGIQAGDGGFNITVKGNTDLNGGAIASSQAAIDANRNSLVTGTLTQNDIQNRDSYAGSSVSVSGGISGKLGDQGSAVKPADVRATQAPTGSGMGAGAGKDSGSASGVTKSGISGGAIAIIDTEKQRELTGKDADETIASLNRDIVSGQNGGALTKNWDIEQLQDKVAAQAAITQAFLPMAARAVGDYASRQERETRDLARNEADPARKAALEAEADKWKEGGVYRVALHTAVGALGGGVNGAAGAAASASAAQLMDGLQAGVQEALQGAGLNANAAGAIAQGVAGLTATGMGAAVGGTVGAATALNVDFNNRQLHPKEIDWIKRHAKVYAAQHPGMTEVEAEKALAQQAYRQVQNGAAGTWDANASAFLESARGMLDSGGDMGYMFHAIATQKADVGMYANYLPKTADFYAKNGLTIPNAQQLAQGNQRDSNARETAGTLTKLAAVASGATVLSGLSPTLLIWTLGNPVEATKIGLITAETAAAIQSGAITPTLVAEGAAAKAAQTAANSGRGVRYLNNSTAPEIQQRLSSTVSTIRSEAGMPIGGNVGFAEVSIPAVSKEQLVMKAYSGYDEAVDSFLPKPYGSMDTWILKPSEATSRYVGGPAAYLRDVDTEFKILETVAQRLGNNTTASGQINLFTEKLVCPSCSDVVTQFRQRYPNIQLNVFTGK